MVLDVGKTTGLRWALVVAATLLACGAVLGSAAAAPCGISWTTVPSAPELRVPRAIAPVAPDDIWIVGHRSLGRATGAEHWDGNTWTNFPTPNAQGTQNALLGADALSSDDVWAVGYSKPRGYRTLVERWNGTSWKVVQSPNVGTESNALVGVDVVGPGLAWAVGYYRQDKTHRKTLILRWDGASWSVVPSPSPGALSNALLGVAAVDEDNIWAVGYRSSGAGYRSLVLRYDGASWTEVKVPTAGDGDNVLTGVSAVPGGEVWAAGYLVSGTRHKALTLRHDSGAWDRVPSANGGEAVTALRDVDASSPTDAWAVGLEYRANRGQYAASTQRWDGSSWTAVPSAISQSSTNKSEMLAVAKAPGTSQVWAAGQPANVETICPSGGTIASTSSQEPGTSTVSAVDSARVPERPRLPQTEAPISSRSAETTITATAANAVDKAADAGISELTKTRGAIIADFDNDGLKDIFLNRHQLPARLYINDGDGHFTETNEGTFGRSDRHGCDAADVNNDGLKDIFCPEGAALGTQATRSELYIHQPGHTFVDQAARYGVFQPFARGRSGTFVKANGDAYPDLFAANDENRADGLPSPNRLFINQAGSAYRHAPEFGLEHEVGDGASTGGNPDVGDLDKDGWQDLLVETAAGLRVYHNKRGNGFTDVATSVGLGHDPKDAILADVNGDTWLDVVEVFDNELRVMLNTTDGRFSTAFSAPLTLGLSVAAGDVNGDNRADIYLMRENDDTGANAPDQVYLNDGTGKSFAPMSSIPSTTEGTAESVWPIDHDGNGLTDFLVLNGEGEGGNAQGPVQLIAFFPAP